MSCFTSNGISPNSLVGGSDGQVLTTQNDGTVNWSDVPSAGGAAIAEVTDPAFTGNTTGRGVEFTPPLIYSNGITVTFAGGNRLLTIDQPGNYLVRYESSGTVAPGASLVLSINYTAPLSVINSYTYGTGINQSYNISALVTGGSQFEVYIVQTANTIPQSGAGFGKLFITGI